MNFNILLDILIATIYKVKYNQLKDRDNNFGLCYTKFNLLKMYKNSINILYKNRVGLASLQSRTGLQDSFVYKGFVSVVITCYFFVIIIQILVSKTNMDPFNSYEYNICD